VVSLDLLQEKASASGTVLQQPPLQV